MFVSIYILLLYSLIKYFLFHVTIPTFFVFAGFDVVFFLNQDFISYDFYSLIQRKIRPNCIPSHAHEIQPK